MTTVDEILERLEGVKPSGSGWTALCPAHEDTSPSLSVNEGDDGTPLLRCQAGCSWQDVFKALGMNSHKDESPEATYEYIDEHGSLLYQVLRFPEKKFRQRQPDGSGGWIWNMQGARKVLYRLPEVIAKSAEGGFVFVVEGEKDVEAIRSAGLVATCSVGGSGSWKKEYGKYFQGAQVIIWPDKDGPGHSYARAIRDSVAGIAASVTAVESKEGKDAYDHLVVHKLPIGEVVPIAIRASEDVVALSDIEIKSVEWHLEHFVQVGAFHLLIGEGGVGKGAWLAQLSSKITQAATGCPTAPQGVLVVISEDSPDMDLLPRILASGGDPSKVFVIKKHIFLPRDIDYLEKTIEERRAGLLVIDPVANHIGGSSDEEVSVRLAINELNFVAARTGCSIFGVRHTPKSDPLSALGSVAWTNSPRIVLLLQKFGEGSKRVLSVKKSNRGVTGKYKDYRLVSTAVQGVSNHVPLVLTEDEYLSATTPAPTPEETQDDWLTQQ